MNRTVNVTLDFDNTRLDRWIRKNISIIPQSLIEKSLRQGLIKVNNKKAKRSHKLKFNDSINIYNFNPTEKNLPKTKYAPNKKEISSSESFIIENNDNFIVVNKPAGVPVQGGTKSYKNLVDTLSKSEIFKNTKPYIVHRIDKDTSGILLISKTRQYAQLLTSLFRIRKIYKTYIAICEGPFEKDSGELINNLERYEGKKKIIENAKTKYKVIDKNNLATLLSLNPITGRKHQIRKQLAIIDHPILGDKKYNIRTRGDNLMLHAYSIMFKIDNIKFNYKVSYPDYFKKALQKKRLKFI